MRAMAAATTTEPITASGTSAAREHMAFKAGQP
jgi:hypothetical protein